MKIYDINPNTNELINELGRTAPLDNMSGGYKIPNGSTLAEPKSTLENEINVFNIETREWDIKSDFRGFKYFLAESQDENEITEIGVEPPADHLTEAPPIPEEQLKLNLINELNIQRRTQESIGITLNDIRYSGEIANRQTLSEAIEFLEDAGAAFFPTWKDSDNEYTIDHPLSDVKQAYKNIGMRRSELIGLERVYIEQIQAGILTNVDDLTWQTEE
jgi:hypothetical protein